MAELRPIPFEQLIERILVEPRRQETLFDLPLRKVWRPRAGLDLSVAVHGERAQTPVGPAAGPHAQSRARASTPPRSASTSSGRKS
jgi:putative selenate reductase